MKEFLLFLKNLIQLILRPRLAWQAVKDDDKEPSRLMAVGFYPLLGLTAITAVTHGLYDIHSFSIGHQLQLALIQFLSLFLCLFLARAAFEFAIPRLTINPPTASNFKASNTVTIYCLSLLAVIQIIANCCPVELSIIWFLPAFVAVIACQSAEYLGISPYKTGPFVFIAIILLVAMPIVTAVLLGILIN